MSLDNDENRPLYETISNKEDVSIDERIELENSMCTLTEDEKNKFYKKNYCELLEASIRKNDKNNYDRFISEIKKYGTLGCDEIIRIILLKYNDKYLKEP